MDHLYTRPDMMVDDRYQFILQKVRVLQQVRSYQGSPPAPTMEVTSRPEYRSREDRPRESSLGRRNERGERYPKEIYSHSSDRRPFGRDMSKDKCFQCGRFGHWSSNCPDYPASRKPRDPSWYRPGGRRGSGDSFSGRGYRPSSRDRGHDERRYTPERSNSFSGRRDSVERRVEPHDRGRSPRDRTQTPSDKRSDSRENRPGSRDKRFSDRSRSNSRERGFREGSGRSPRNNDHRRGFEVVVPKSTGSGGGPGQGADKRAGQKSHVAQERRQVE